MAASAALLCSASEVSDAVNADIFRAIAPTGGASVVVSPYSAAFCAGLLGDGMDSRDARIALSSRLGMKTVEFGATFMRIRSQLSEWTLTNRVGVLFANSFWMRNYTRIDCDFHMMAHRSYDVAFGPLFGVEAMNAWSRARTDGLVTKAMDEVDLSCDTAIVSAAAFNGAWARPFPPAEPGAFHAPGGDVELPMMKDVRTVRGVRRPEYDAFALPYRGGRLFLYVMIPSGGRSPLDLRCPPPTSSSSTARWCPATIPKTTAATRCRRWRARPRRWRASRCPGSGSTPRRTSCPRWRRLASRARGTRPSARTSA